MFGPKRVLRGKRAIVTGASGGIGRAIAEHLARAGVQTVLAARSGAKLDAITQTLTAEGHAAVWVEADITSAEDRARMVQVAAEQFGGLDILVNNAGVGAAGHFQLARPERLRTIMELNFFALAETTRLAIPLLKHGHEPVIVNLASVLGRRGFPSRSEYSASKFAVCGFSQALRPELDKDGIEVLVVNPGFTATGFEEHMLEDVSKLKMTRRRTMSADAVAAATLRAIERHKSEVLLSRSGRLLILVNTLLPRFVDRMMARVVRKHYAAAAAQPATASAGGEAPIEDARRGDEEDTLSSILAPLPRR